MFRDLAKVTIANVIVLFLGFLRDLVLSYNFGISKFTDSFFSIYLLVEDFNVIINTGDYIIADEDGVVIIPKNNINDIIDKARNDLNSENKMRSAILNGEDPQKAYLKYRKF